MIIRIAMWPPSSMVISVQSFFRTLLSLALMLSGPAFTVIGATSSQVPESLADALKSASRSTLSARSSLDRSALAQRYFRTTHGRLGLGLWNMVQILAAFSIILSYNVWRKRSTKAVQQSCPSGSASRPSGDYSGPASSNISGSIPRARHSVK